MFEEVNLTEFLLNSFKVPIIACDLQENVLFWGCGAEDLFGYSKNEVLGKKLEIVPINYKEEFKIAIDKALLGQTVSFKTKRYNRRGDLLDVLVVTSPLFHNKKLVGISFVVHDVGVLRNAIVLHSKTDRETKRTFGVIRESLLLCLTKGRMTINQIANGSGINWKTVEKHLTYLIGRKLVEEVFSSEYVRIFELTPRGKEFVEGVKAKELSKIIKI